MPIRPGKTGFSSISTTCAPAFAAAIAAAQPAAPATGNETVPLAR